MSENREQKPELQATITITDPKPNDTKSAASLTVTGTATGLGFFLGTTVTLHLEFPQDSASNQSPSGIPLFQRVDDMTIWDWSYTFNNLSISQRQSAQVTAFLVNNGSTIAQDGPVSFTVMPALAPAGKG